MFAAAALLDGLLGAAILAQVWRLLLRNVIFRKVLFNNAIFRNVIFKKDSFRIRLVVFRIIPLPKDLQKSPLAFIVLNVVVFDELMGIHQVGMIDLV